MVTRCARDRRPFRRAARVRTSSSCRAWQIGTYRAPRNVRDVVRVPGRGLGCATTRRCLRFGHAVRPASPPRGPVAAWGGPFDHRPDLRIPAHVLRLARAQRPNPGRPIPRFGSARRAGTARCRRSWHSARLRRCSTLPQWPPTTTTRSTCATAPRSNCSTARASASGSSSGSTSTTRPLGSNVLRVVGKGDKERRVPFGHPRRSGGDRVAGESADRGW